jgi:hypothetical protein
VVTTVLVGVADVLAACPVVQAAPARANVRQAAVTIRRVVIVFSLV